MSELLNRKSCECGKLNESAKDKFMPIKKKGDKFILILLNEKEEDIYFCFFCGGYEFGPATQRIYTCKCETLKNLSQNPEYPVKFDSKFKEYYLEGKDKSTHIFYFCPKCGGKLAKSKRNDFFTTPSDKEIKQIATRLKNINEIEDIIKIFGLPDKEHDYKKVSKTDKRIYKLKDLKRTLVFNSIAKTLNLIVQEDEDGKVIYFFVGKPKKRNEEAH